MSLQASLMESGVCLQEWILTQSLTNNYLVESVHMLVQLYWKVQNLGITEV